MKPAIKHPHKKVSEAKHCYYEVHPLALVVAQIA